MSTGCNKENKPPTWLKFNLLLETVNLDDPIRYLFVVDIFFDKKNPTKKHYLYNEIFPPIIEKQKTLETNERSAYQLLELFDKTNNKQKWYRCTTKSHATIFKKQFIPLYLEDLRFLIKKRGWKVTKIYNHLTFEQPRFKRDFLLTNQRKRQNAKRTLKKTYKLMNNANVSYDCRNNANNTKFQLIIDEKNEITYEKYCNLFDSKVSKFVNSDIIEQQINQEFEQNVSTVKHNNPFRATCLKTFELQKMKNLTNQNVLKKKKKNQEKEK